mmetsp:Transcript_36227/g.55645  ORF Transcript_36227/g.55645 Transcript_36227/m.55645 type:complete len:153 (+) Transcript_36227:483-941(+)
MQEEVGHKVDFLPQQQHVFRSDNRVRREAPFSPEAEDDEASQITSGCVSKFVLPPDEEAQHLERPTGELGDDLSKYNTCQPEGVPRYLQMYGPNAGMGQDSLLQPKIYEQNTVARSSFLVMPEGSDLQSNGSPNRVFRTVEKHSLPAGSFDN